jgi:hypothetical protein
LFLYFGCIVSTALSYRSRANSEWNPDGYEKVAKLGKKSFVPIRDVNHVFANYIHFSMCYLSSAPIPPKVARWFVFKPKIPIWENFGGPLNGKCWCILWPFGIVCGHL